MAMQKKKIKTKQKAAPGKTTGGKKDSRKKVDYRIQQTAGKPPISKSRSKSNAMANETSKERRPSDKSAGDEAAKSQLQGADLATGGSLDKVRDILFGSQAREYEKRFARLEERFAKEASDLRDEVRGRFDSLETYIKKEIESLSQKVKAEQDERKESVRDLARELKELTKAFEKKTGQLDEQLDKSQRELREQILDQSKSLSEDIRRKHEDVSAELERKTEELRFDKTDRSALATMFTELAMRLNNELIIPGSEDLGND